ncbi:MAG TPA: long-chain fatty acid--CoA ligase [Gammaproteobacteria bacterium]|nr:long-chain fatty acid--CoA ligase [Gammaproteobacteria bacterium]
MQGLMMDVPLLIKSIVLHAELNHANQEVVSVTVDHPRHRYTYKDCFRRARQLAKSLDALGVPNGARIATVAWNDFRHLESYFGIACSGRVYHTINPRLFADQLVYIINHAEDEWIFTDVAFVPLLEGIAQQCPSVKGYVVMIGETHMPATTLPNVHCFETLLSAQSADYEWPDFNENTASGLCYTSGTTGNPKGALYSHRSTMLHTYAHSLPDVLNLSALDTILPVVPMFHVNAWGIPFSAPFIGLKLVMPGPKLSDPKVLVDLINQEGVTLGAGVPTVWSPVLQYVKDSGRSLKPMVRAGTGGSACPVSMMQEFRDEHGVEVQHAWGMTEMSPIGSANSPKPASMRLSQAEKDELFKSVGRPVPGVEVKIVDDAGKELPWDGIAFGSLMVRGYWVIREYYKPDRPGAAHDTDGWFETGDVATIDAEGFIRITDRTKDVIKSGGEWISSIELENAAVAHPAVAEAAVIGVYHPKWQERPLLLVVKTVGQEATKEELLHWFNGRVAKWWIPDDVVFIDAMPYTATGKISKLILREKIGDYQFPGSAV